MFYLTVICSKCSSKYVVVLLLESTSHLAGISVSLILLLQEGWLSPTEHASVSAISLRHILASPGYAPATIAVNVTWMERGFNAGQTHSSIYPSIFNRLRAYSEILVRNCNFFLPLAFNAPLGMFPLEFREKVWSSEN